MKLQTENDKLIAKFMGYIYYHPSIDIDYSQYGGMYEKFEVFAKTPILINECENTCYFADVPNPDYKNNDPSAHWRNDLKTLSWSSLNEYKTELNYSTSWSDLIEVILQIESLGYCTVISFDDKTKHSCVINYKKSISNNTDIKHERYASYITVEEIGDTKFETIYNAVLKFIKKYKILINEKYRRFN